MHRLFHAFVFVWAICVSATAFASDSTKVRLDFVYFGGSDCPHCRTWEIFDLPKLKESPVFQHVRLTKVVKTISSPVPSAFWFPDEIKDLRDPIAEKLKGGGSPMFAILNNGKVVASWKGTRTTPDQIVGIIEKQLGASSATASPSVGNENVGKSI